VHRSTALQKRAGRRMTNRGIADNKGPIQLSAESPSCLRQQQQRVMPSLEKDRIDSE
jgi:hypothetical protein